MKISIADLTAYAIAHDERLGLVLDENDPNPTYYLSEATPLFSAFLRDHGLYVDGDHVHYDPTQHGAIELQCNAFIDEYDDDGGPADSWTQFGLQGDDDVDYNGGYVLVFLELVEDFLKNQSVT
jgi:hypothetical protein